MPTHSDDSDLDRALQEDARKLEEQGQDPGPTIDDLFDDEPEDDEEEDLDLFENPDDDFIDGDEDDDDDGEDADDDLDLDRLG